MLTSKQGALLAAGLALLVLVLLGASFLRTPASALHRGALPTPSGTPTQPAAPPPTSPPTQTLQSPPTSTVRPAPTGVTYPLDQIRGIQDAVDRRDPGYLYYLDPVAVTKRDLPRHGFNDGPIGVLMPPPGPRPTMTPHANEHNIPEVDTIVRYAGRQYWIVLDQLVREGAGGIWLIITITPM